MSLLGLVSPMDMMVLVGHVGLVGLWSLVGLVGMVDSMLWKNVNDHQ